MYPGWGRSGTSSHTSLSQEALVQSLPCGATSEGSKVVCAAGDGMQREGWGIRSQEARKVAGRSRGGKVHSQLGRARS